MIHLKDGPGEKDYSWIWEHNPFFVRAYLNYQTLYWWAEVGKVGQIPQMIMSYKSLEDLIEKVEKHLLDKFPESQEVLYPPPALIRVDRGF